MDCDERGRHAVEIFAELPGGRRLIAEPHALSGYGFTLEHEGTLYRPSIDDLEKVHSLRSLSPDVTPSGVMTFEITPPVLGYLRRSTGVEEWAGSKDIEIRQEPLRPSVDVDFSAATGAMVRAGYRRDDGGLSLVEELNRTPDGDYVRIGKAFVPLPEPVGVMKDLITRGTTAVAIDQVPEFFTRDLLALRLAADVRLTPAAGQVTVVDAPKPRFTLDAGVPGWLDLDVTYGSGNAQVSLRQAAEAVHRGSSVVHVGPAGFVRIDPAAVREAELLISQLGAHPKGDGYRVPAQRIGTLQDVVARLGGAEEVTQAFQAFLDQLSGLNLDPKAPLPAEIEVTLARQGFTLRPYQRQGIQWLRWLATHGLHGLLADDMGLGKTAQTILSMRATYMEHPHEPPLSVIVCPNSVVRQWERELRRFFPEVHVLVHLGQGRRLSAFEQDEPTVYVTSYATFSRDIASLRTTTFRYLILDEASHIKNPAARRTQAMKQVNAIHRVCLTGTPIENRPAELWSLMDFLLPGHLGQHGTFVRRFEQPILEGDATVALAASETLAKRVSPFLLRRLKEEVAKDLPDKIDHNTECSLTPEQAALYQEVLSSAKPTIDALKRGEDVGTNLFVMLRRLKEICDHPAVYTGEAHPRIIGRSEKFDFILETIDEIADAGEKVLVFSHILRTLDLLGTSLDAAGIRHIRIDGSTPDVRRQELVDEMNHDAGVTVALLSLGATGYGLNLQAANHVIHVDRWWNPAAEDQATARAHRIGQLKTVIVHRVLVKGTLEERIDWLLNRKRGIADDVIGGAARMEKSLTREELIQLLQPIE